MPFKWRWKNRSNNYVYGKKDGCRNIIYQKETPISNDETVGELYDRLSILGAEAIIEAMPAIIEGTNESIPQDESKVTYSPVISREQEKIDFNKPAVEVYNHVRGLNPWLELIQRIKEKQ